MKRFLNKNEGYSEKVFHSGEKEIGRRNSLLLIGQKNFLEDEHSIAIAKKFHLILNRFGVSGESIFPPVKRRH